MSCKSIEFVISKTPVDIIRKLKVTHACTLPPYSKSNAEKQLSRTIIDILVYNYSMIHLCLCLFSTNMFIEI